MDTIEIKKEWISMHSVWSEKSKLPEFPALESDIDTDILIIGGGLSGILTAYFLQKRGLNYILVEKDKICRGITKNTTAKITFQHGLIYKKILKSYGLGAAQMYLQANKKAFEMYRLLCQNINCDFEIMDNYVYSTQDKNKLEDEMNALNKIGYPAQFVQHLSLPFDTFGAVKFPEQAQFNPLKFISAIAKGLNIYENTKVIEMADNTAITNQGKIHAKKIIVTTHFPFINKHGSYFLKLYQHRSYVIALKNGPDMQGMYVDENNKGMSFRNYNKLLILGGGGHRTGKKGGNWTELRQFAATHYPQAKEMYFWATQDCMSLDGIPYIGKYSKNTHELFVATGFNKWGMTSSMISAMLLSDMAEGKQNPYSEIFDPSRSILKPQLLVNGFEAITNLLSFSTKRCPHLGCALKWNSTEHSWDCPCHGSRFTQEGRVIDNPSNGDLKK